MKKLLIIGLLFVNFTCLASLFENNETDSLVDIARFPLLVHYCEKADTNEDVKNYIGTAMFGTDWKRRLEVAKISVITIDFSVCPPPAYGVIERTIQIRAQQEDRKDVLSFLHANSYHKERKFNSWK